MASYNAITELLENNETFPAYASPGGYPMFYLCEDSGILCPSCVNKERKLVDAAKADGNDPQWHVVAYDINYEDASLYCDHCKQRIESAYAEDEANAS